MSWRRISGSAEITAEASDETHGITKLFGLRQSFFFSVSLKHLDLQVGEQDLGGKLRTLPAEQGHQHDPPGNHQIDGDGTLQTFGVSMCQGLNSAATFQDAMPVFDAPAQAVPTQTLVSLLDGGDLAGGQQEPLDGFDIGWGGAFPHVHHPQRDRRFVLVRRRRGELDFPIP